MLKIRIFAVGGTIDKIYFDARSTYQVGPPNIEKVLSELVLNFEYVITSLLQKDSLDMDDADRQLVYDRVGSAAEEHIVITHGTDTMIETAKALSGIEGKTIVLTGALAPALFRTSDAMFNIGCAVAAVQSKPHGVYIAMNGRIFDHDKVIKDLEKNRFVPLDG